MKPVRTNIRRPALLVPHGVMIALLLAAVSACSPVTAGSMAPAPQGAAGPSAVSSSAPPHPAPVAAAAPATLAAKTRLEDALAKVAGASVPSTDQIRAALADAGFPSGTIEVTAGRTPTGLAADAVEAAVRQDQDCVVAQLRAGALAVAVLPALAGGRCLAGSAA